MKSTHLMALSGVTVACLLALSAPAMAGDDIDISLKNGGLKITSGDNEFKIGGKIQMDYVNFSDDTLDRGGVLGDGSNNRRTHLEFEGKIGQNWGFKYERDFAGQKTKSAYISYKGLGPGTLKLGQDKKPYGLEEVTSDSWVTFIERSEATNAFADGGAYALGAIYGGTGDMFGAWVAVQGDDVDTSNKGGNDPIFYTGRVIFSPTHTSDQALHFGVSVMHGNYNNKDVTTQKYAAKTDLRSEATTDIVSSTVAADSVTQYGLEFAGVFGPFSTSAEYYKAKTKGTSGNQDYDFDGYYVEAGYFLQGGNRNYKFKDGKFDRPSVKDAWEIAARYGRLDLTDAASATNKAAGDAKTITVGLNYYPNPAIKLSINASRTKAEYDGFNPDENVKSIGMRAQVAF